jgi:replicative DNA helicase
MQFQQRVKSMRRTTGNLVSDIGLTGKVPPQAIEIEDAVLGAAMVDASCLPVIIGLISEDAFYKSSNGLIFHAIKQLYDCSRPVDILTVSEQLRSEGKLEEVGGSFYVANLMENIISGLNAEEHCRILIEKQIKRSIAKAAQQSYEMALDDTTDAFDCISVLEMSVANTNQLMASGGNMVRLNVLVDEAEKLAHNREKQYKEGKCTGIPTGIKMLDKRTTGWQNSELIILAGRPSMGKTALMLHHAMKSGVNVCIYSLEMSGVSLANRMILSMADIDVGRFRAGAMGQEDWVNFQIAKYELNKLPIYIDDNPVVTTRYIRSHSRLMRDRGKCDIIFVDYLQLADMRSDQIGRNREQEVSQATREFKIIAKTLDIPVVLLSQLSRQCEQRPDKRPMLSDLRESGAIEQDADIVIFAYRPAYYGLTDSSGNSQDGIGYEIIAKGRNIGIGEITFRHNESMTKIWDYIPDEELPF